MATDPLAPVHPGEILREEFLAPLGMTPYALAAACRLPPAACRLPCAAHAHRASGARGNAGHA